MGKSSRDKYIKYGSILAITSFLVRIIGMLYRIPMTAIIGDRGNGLYAGAFEIYNIILLISTYTLPMAISKIVSPYFATYDFKNAYKFYKLAFVFALITGSIFSAFTFFGSDFLSGVILKSPMSAIALRVLAPTILVVSIMGVMRGFFQSTGSMTPTSISQIIEQIINAIISVVAAFLLFNYGSKITDLTGAYDLPYAYGAAGGTVGTLSGAIVGLFYLSIVIFIFNFDIKKRAKKQISTQSLSYISMFKILFLTILPIIISTAVYNFNTILNQGIFYHTMSAKNFSAKEYESMWGIFSGKYRLLCNVPIAFAGSMATSVIPSLSVSISDNDKRRIIHKKLHRTVKMVMLFTMPCVVGLSILSAPIIDMLFNGSDSSQKMASNMLLFGSIIVLFTALSTLSTGFLQGLGKMKAPVINSFIALLIQLIIFKLLLDKTTLGIYAMIISNFIFVFIIFILNAHSLKKHIGYRQEIARTFILPSIASIFMGVITFVTYRLALFLSYGKNGIATIFSIIISMIVYFILIIVLKVVKKQEMLSLPKGHKLVKLGEILRLW